MTHIWRTMLLILLLVSFHATSYAQGSVTNDTKRVAIIVSNNVGLSPQDSARARQGALSVADRLKTLGFSFLIPAADGSCDRRSAATSPLGIDQTPAALDCATKLERSTELVVFYYSGTLQEDDGKSHLKPSPSATAEQIERLAVTNLLRAPSGRRTFPRLVLIDAFSVSPDATLTAAAPAPITKVDAPGRSRILAYSAPSGEPLEPAALNMSAYARRLVAALDVEIAAKRDGRPGRDVRDFILDPALTAAPTWPTRTREVRIGRLGPYGLTLAEAPAATSGAEESRKTDRQVKRVDCALAYRNAIAGVECKQIMEAASVCAEPPQELVIQTAIQLRCGEEVVAKKMKIIQAELKIIEAQPTCATLTRFVDRHGMDFDVADAPEVEKANGMMLKVCADEARQKEIDALENELRAAISRNDCATFRKFEGASGRRLEPQQTERLTAALKNRCEVEQRATAKLRQCIEQQESAGQFCRASDCFRDFRNDLPGDAYFEPHRADSRRHDQICSASAQMRSCFQSDTCGGERCSLPLRLAVGSGPLMRSIQESETAAQRQCTEQRARAEAIRKKKAEEDEAERKRLAIIAAEEAERRRLAARRDATVRLTLCNHSSRGRIFVAVSYYDYDTNDWIVEGWWAIAQGDCSYIGDRFRRGSLRFYAHNNQERWVWKGDFGLCVAWSRFRRVNRGSYTCNSSRHRMFFERSADSEEYTQNFN